MGNASSAYDLIVVGGGPSGSSAARRAGLLGLRTLLVEKEAFPRYKACAGALSETARRLLDFELPAELCGPQILGARAHYRGRCVECQMPFPLATTVTRSLFDDYLLQKAREAGVEVKMAERALGFTQTADRVELQTSQGAYRSPFLLVAEGSQGRLVRQVRRKDRPTEFAACLVTEVELGEEAVTSRFGHLADIHFGVVPLGYAWILPHRRHLSVGVGGLGKGLHNLKGRLVGFLAAQGLSGGGPFRAHTVPVGGKRRRLASGRVLLCGDAAGFADAWTAEGIAYAIRSGQIAAEVIGRAAAGTANPTCLQEYPALCHREFGRGLRHSFLLAALLHGLSGLTYRVLASNERALAKTLELPAGRASHGEVLRWLLWRFPWLVLGSLRPQSGHRP
ncbi:MAG TPA: geranylgeranyl reductase family protein [Planctomycetota bacterium]|nr:geranylgeranyl reductase family protein [Planctomycetota bacterium]